MEPMAVLSDMVTETDKEVAVSPLDKVSGIL